VDSNKKSFDYIWSIIEVPVLIVILYSFLDLAFSINTYISKVIPSGIFNAALTLFVFGWIGYNTVRIKDETPQRAARYGAYAGVILGLISAIIGIITFYFFPEKIVEAIQKAVQAGADASTVRSIMKIGIYASLIISPAINAAIGAFLAWIGGLIFKKK